MPLPNLLCSELHRAGYCMSTLCKPSLYNHAFPYKGEMLLFNGLSSALTSIPRATFDRVEEYLFAGEPFDLERVTDIDVLRVLGQLTEGRFFLDGATDELDILRRRTQASKKEK